MAKRYIGSDRPHAEADYLKLAGFAIGGIILKEHIGEDLSHWAAILGYFGSLGLSASGFWVDQFEVGNTVCEGAETVGK